MCFWPPFISTTSSTGTRILPNLSVMPARLIRSSSARCTDFSKPEYAWTTYQSEEHTSELQSQSNLVCRLLLEKKKGVTTRALPQQTIVLQYRRHIHCADVRLH